MSRPRVILVARVAAGIQAVALAIVALLGLAFALFSLLHDLRHSSRQLAGVGEVLGGFVLVLFGCSALLIWLPTRRLSRERAAAIILVLAEVMTAVLVGVSALQAGNSWSTLASAVYIALALAVLVATVIAWPPATED